MRFLGSGFLVVLLAGARLLAVSSPADIPSPRPHSWIADQAHVLPAEKAIALDQLLNEVHRHDGAELAIVTVETINGANPRRFATDLFNRWGVGDHARHNGLLLFVAVRDRKAEIILGRGLDSAAQVARSDRIMAGIIVPRFRAGDGAGAIDSGARACAEQFFAVQSPAPARHEAADTPVERSALPRPNVGSGATNDDALLVLIPLAAVLGTVGVTALSWFLVRRYCTDRAHSCPQCQRVMTRLDEAQDNAHLTPTELAEERIGSVDYVVWLCPTCLRVDKVRHGRWFTQYSACPSCGAKTRNSVTRTLAAATTVSTGIVEVREFCHCCNDTRVTTRVLPVVVETSSSSSSSSGFGGGSSSGGGSSGSW